jgi:hypothetical protein
MTIGLAAPANFAGNKANGKKVVAGSNRPARITETIVSVAGSSHPAAGGADGDNGEADEAIRDGKRRKIGIGNA